jgi:hypothetical protein
MPTIYRPTVVIGIGGTGKGIILALKKMIAENSKNGMRDYPFLKFLSIDTDAKTGIEIESAIKTIDKSELKLNPEKEVFPLSVNYNTLPNLEADYPKIKEWFPSSLESFITAANMGIGACQRKPIGRFGFAWNADELYRKLSLLLQNPVDIQTANDYAVGTNLSDSTNVFICGSICGGTGAGTFLDIAYMIRHIQSTLASGRQLFIYGMFALSTLFEEKKITLNTKPNCYASLMELDFFMNKCNFENPFRRFRPAYKNSFGFDYSISAKNPPFDYPFLFDNSNSHFSLTSMDDFFEMCARFIYLLTGHEVSNTWYSADSNVRALLDIKYNLAVYNKPNTYRSMGAYSIMYPRRMITQVCAHKLAKEYFARILNAEDTGDQINRIAERFMDDVKLNPNNDSLKNSFDWYLDESTDSTGEKISFTSYIDSCKTNAVEQLKEEDKKEIVAKVREWKDEMDKKVSIFRQQNSDAALRCRKAFLENLYIRIGDTLDLTLRKDPANMDRMVRGSVIRVQKMLSSLITTYTDVAEKLRREEEATAASIKQCESDYETALNDLKDVVDSILSTKGKIADRMESAIDAAAVYLNAKRSNLICNWARQLLTGILENNIPREQGLIKELENRKKIFDKIVIDFNEISKEVDKFLDSHKRYDSNLCDVIFDYETDVEGVYKQMLVDKTEDTVFATLSDELRKDGLFGSAYEKLGIDDRSLITRNLLLTTENYFFEPVRKIKISERLLNTPGKLNLLTNGTYYYNANVYIGLNGTELDKVNLSTRDTNFFAITIPNEYNGRPCEGIKGDIQACQIKICPQDNNPDEYKGDNACPMYGKCLKKLILANAPQHLAIEPTEETSEINIIETIAGFPLHALNTTASIKIPYTQIKEINAKKQAGKENQEEELHMFGPIEFTDLFEKTEDPRTLTNGFRETLMFALGVRRLLIEDNKVSYYTQRDKQNKASTPSLVLGNSLDQVMDRFMSTRQADIAMVKQITDEMDFFKGVMKSDKAVFDQASKIIEETFTKIRDNLPRGMKTEDLDLLNKVSIELCNKKLIQDEGPISWF